VDQSEPQPRQHEGENTEHEDEVEEGHVRRVYGLP
jgi:hypothetical protein